MATNQSCESDAKVPSDSNNGNDTNELHPIHSAILECVSDKNSYLYALAGTPYIVQTLWELIVQYWKETIIIPTQFNEWTFDNDIDYNAPPKYDIFAKPYVNWCRFPKPKDININMMPFIMSNTFSKTKLPNYLKGYANIIQMCNIEKEEMGKVCYLSIQESRVEGNTSQRRPGIHTECPGNVRINDCSISKGMGKCNAHFLMCHPWGEGHIGSRHNRVGGIYMASTSCGSCRVWNCKIPQDPQGREIIGDLGDIEHLRQYLPKPMEMDANNIFWITDRTPHESMPLEAGSYRQWFRLVTSKVGLWFEDHSSQNPNGVVPDPIITQIVRGSKFKDNDLVFADEPMKKSKKKCTVS